MSPKEEHQAMYDDVCRVLGRAIIMLKETGQPITDQTLHLMLQIHNDQTKDLYLTKIHTTARRVIG
ncbi:hypothetical protein SB6415_00129 [Klebsiella pasteurii]|uniref:DUF2767 family protein n=1 Tax=Klebsiella pasteurii TaxID=2587529 RepID=UPI00115A3FE7|nr:DUF2767 family protein [Klebsiella pasteurii]VUS57510.1 hypothetical protein SB6415_00129 [Klebsiella pasteurii]